MQIIHEISIDFQRIGIRPRIHVKENDMATRYVHVAFYNDGEPYAVTTTGTEAVMCYAKPDGTSGVYTTIGEGTAIHNAYRFDSVGKGVQIELAPSMMIGFGLLRCEVRLVKGGEILGTFTFEVDVERSVTTGTKADDYFSYRAFDELYAAIDNAEEYAQIATATSANALSIANDLADRIDNAEGYAEYASAKATNALNIAEGLADSVEQAQADADAALNRGAENADAIAGIDERLTSVEFDVANLKAAVDGRLVRAVTEETLSAVTLTVPAGAMPFASIGKIYGGSAHVNQIQKAIPDVSASSSSGCSVAKSEDGLVVFPQNVTYCRFDVGDAMTRVVRNHKYLFGFSIEYFGLEKPVEVVCRDNSYTWTGNPISVNGVGNFAGIFQPTAALGTTFRWQIKAVSGSLVSGTSITFGIQPILVDLTAWFGSGNEPETVADAFARGISYGMAYNTGEDKIADIISIVSGGVSKIIPAAVRQLNGYGSDGTYVDYSTKMYFDGTTLTSIADLIPAGFDKLPVVGGGEITLYQSGVPVAVHSIMSYLIPTTGGAF